MPRVQIGRPIADYSKYVDALFKELSGVTTGVEPVIYEHEQHVNEFHVIVVWSKWKEVPTDLRTLIIIEAYEKYDDKMGRSISTALGVTMEEGVRLRILPYQVVPVTGESAEARRLSKKEFLKLGGVVSKGEWILGFPNEEKAQEAMNLLKKRVREVQWKVFNAPTGSDE